MCVISVHNMPEMGYRQQCSSTSFTHILKAAETIKTNQKEQKSTMITKSLSHCKEPHANKFHINEVEGQVTD